ncbi:hypothetical protein Sya03_42660 [Spirilliplanes yamanashiensis]|uniref:Uncharacterized protein n=1 Tax=Spirilliplanes yamanashiensis TaxID=42233 RepID=A0A8J3YBM2_9ACTN|nr:hypothetical protein Sya03_42660 [Spirilliplanes yamanashiensis]
MRITVSIPPTAAGSGPTWAIVGQVSDEVVGRLGRVRDSVVTRGSSPARGGPRTLHQN